MTPAQLYGGAIVAVLSGTGVLGSPVVLRITALAALAAGGLILLGPVSLKTRLQVEEVVTTLLINSIIFLFVSYLLEGPMKDPVEMGWPRSATPTPEARLPRLVTGLRLHRGFALALVAAGVVRAIHTRMTLGFEMRAVAQNPAAACFAGVPLNAVLIRTALLSGGLAGLAGGSGAAGLRGHLSLGLSPGVWLCRHHRGDAGAVAPVGGWCRRCSWQASS